jgi:hypothetical protein
MTEQEDLGFNFESLKNAVKVITVSDVNQVFDEFYQVPGPGLDEKTRNKINRFKQRRERNRKYFG